ncbi:MAG: hypothetical protein ACOCZ5_01250 [bacterium]
MAQYAIITSAGLNAISQASDSGEFINIKYYVPAYDDTIPLTAADIKDYVSSADTDLDGQELWAQSGTSGTYYDGVTYSPIVDDTNTSRGNFKVTVRPNYDIIFNKIALYLEDETLFAQVMIPQQITLETSGASQYGGDVTIDFQLESNNDANFREIFYASSEDYWVRIVNEQDNKFGILYDGEVHINSQFDTEYDEGELDDLGISKLFITTHHTLPGENGDRERTIPQLCLQFVSKTSSIIKRIRTTFRTTEEGHCELDFYGGCQDSGYSLIPKKNELEGGDDPGLGLEDYKWHHIYLSNIFEMYQENQSVGLNDDGYRPNDSNNSFIKFDLETEKAIFHNVDVYCNKYFYGNLKNYPGEDLTIESDNSDIIINSGNNIILQSISDSGIIQSYISILPMGNGIVNRRLGGSGTNEQWSFLYVNNIISTGNIIIHSNLIPTDTLNLGSEDKRWSNIYTNELDANFVKGEEIDCTEIIINDGGEIRFDDDQLVINKDSIFGPGLSIGSSENPVENIHINNLYLYDDDGNDVTQIGT